MKRFTSAMLSLLIVAAVVCSGGPALAAPVSIALDFTSAAGNVDKTADGYFWDKDNLTLTLSGLNLTYTGDTTELLRLPANSKIILTGTNTITNNYNDTGSSVSGVFCLGDLTIEGTGELRITTTIINVGHSRSAYGLNVYGNLTVDDATVTANVTHPRSGDAYGVLTDNSGAITVNSGSLSGSATTGDGDAAGMSSAGAITVNGGTVTANGTATGDGSGSGMGGSSVEVNGGAVTVTGTSTTGAALGVEVSGLTVNGGVFNVTAAASSAGDGAAGVITRTLEINDGELNSSASCPGGNALVGIMAGSSATYTGGKLTLNVTGSASGFPPSAYRGAPILDDEGNPVITDLKRNEDYGFYFIIEDVPVTSLTLGAGGGGSGGAAPSEEKKEERKTRPDTPPPIVAVLYDVTKTGDTFSFKTIIANARGSMPGATVTVKLNESYSTTVTIGEDGVGFGTIDAPGYAWDTAHISARPNMPGAVAVGVTYDIFGDGRVVRR